MLNQSEIIQYIAKLLICDEDKFVITSLTNYRSIRWIKYNIRNSDMKVLSISQSAQITTDILELNHIKDIFDCIIISKPLSFKEIMLHKFLDLTPEQNLEFQMMYFS